MTTEERPQTAAEIAKHRLKRYLPLKLEVQHLKERIDALYGPRIPNSDGMPHASGVSDPTGNTATLIVERRERYEAREQEFAELEAAIERDMEMLSPTERDLIRYRYMDGQEWEEVCISVRYSWAQTHRIHSAALIKLGEIEKAKPQE